LVHANCNAAAMANWQAIGRSRSMSSSREVCSLSAYPAVSQLEDHRVRRERHRPHGRHLFAQMSQHHQHNMQCNLNSWHER
jgi:hypothetical protein